MTNTNTQLVHEAALFQQAAPRVFHRYLKVAKSLKQKGPRTYRTRPDPFVDVDQELQRRVANDQGLDAKALLDWLMIKNPGKFNAGHLRTLQRRLRSWRNQPSDGDTEQPFIPGVLSQSDLVVAGDLQITIAGESFPHMLFYFMLPFSRWEFVCVAQGELFDSLNDGYSQAVRRLKAVTILHRPLNAAAVVPPEQLKLFEMRWQLGLARFDVKLDPDPFVLPEPGKSSIGEDFKQILDQRLDLRGSRDFATQKDYSKFIQQIAERRNKQRREMVDEEMKHLRPLVFHAPGRPQVISNFDPAVQ